jgi:hypothetical protein
MTAPKRGRPILWTFVVLISAFAGAAIARYALPDLGGVIGRSQNAQVDAQISELRSQLRAANIDELRSRVDALEKRPGGDVAQLAERLTAAEQATADLRASISAFQSTPQTDTNGAPVPSDSLAAVNNAATVLNNQIADLSAHLAASETALKASDSAFNDRISAIEQRVPADLTAQIANFAPKSDLQNLDKRIASLESNTAAIDAKHAAAAVALAELARGAGSGAPFAHELAAVQTLQIDPSMIAPIAAYADKGVRPQSDIIASFDGAARAALKADRSSSGDWWTRLWSNLTSMFLVRKTGPMQGSSTEAVLSRAGDRAHAGDLKVALAELKGLRGPAAGAMASWEKEAQARADLDDLLRSLTTTLLSTFTPQAQP